MDQKVNQLQKSLALQLKFVGSTISKQDAMGHINYYRSTAPPDSLKSVFLDKAAIEFILENATRYAISGIRIYLAKYDGIHSPSDPELKDKPTLILALTTGITDPDRDIETAYFNYGKPCPPDCGGDDGRNP